jgi:DNA-directed RNA polymerase subunit omega
MARVTVEDCMSVVENRFELVVVAARRAKDIASGARLTVERDNDKNAVIALREIAQGSVQCDILRESIVKGLQKRMKYESNEDEHLDENAEGQTDELAMEFMQNISHIGTSDDIIEESSDFSFEEDINLDD